MELGGKKAAALIPRLGRDADTNQQLLARATGNYQHGNERRPRHL